MNHDTGKTSAALARHLGRILSKPLDFEFLKEEDHDGFDGEPVASVMVNGVVTLYPHETKTETIGESVTQTKWAVDIIVDASDPSVGIYGGEPKNIFSELGFVDAMIRVGQYLIEDEVCASVVVEIDEDVEA